MPPEAHPRDARAETVPVEATLNEIARGEASPAQARATLVRLLRHHTPHVLEDIYLALRASTWRTLDQRRRDAELRDWYDIASSCAAVLKRREPTLAAKLEVLHELLGESLAAGAVQESSLVLRRQHVAKAVYFLARHGDWAPRAALDRHLKLSQPNLTRVLNLMSGGGLIERRPDGKEAQFRLTRAGLDAAQQLAKEDAALPKLVCRPIIRQPDRSLSEVEQALVAVLRRSTSRNASNTKQGVKRASGSAVTSQRKGLVARSASFYRVQPSDMVAGDEPFSADKLRVSGGHVPGFPLRTLRKWDTKRETTHG